ncbi:MAG: hypothetical protein IPL65_09425 [Lewinellaceae bacterium]|nr:hypothetical protein [Lewinellaceae bacterium]
MVDVEVVRKPVARAVVAELRVLDQDIRIEVVACQNAVLVVVKKAVPHREPRAFLPDARAVVVGHRAATELDVFHRGIVPLDYPDGLPLRAGAGGLQVRVAAQAPEQQVVLFPHRHIGRVQSGRDVHGIAILHQVDHLAGFGVGRCGADGPLGSARRREAGKRE